MTINCAQFSVDSSTRNKLRALTLGVTMGASAAAFAFGRSEDPDPPIVHAPGLVDWIADPDHAELGVGCLRADGVVACKEPDVTARAGATGSWYGVRILDGVAGRDDVFASASTFADPSGWTVVTGTVASRHDLGEVHLANTADYLYVGVLRLGNNGVTAVDLEFNRLPPNPETRHLPNRSIGDVLMVLELRGSIGVAIDGFEWDGARWVAFAIPPNTDRRLNARVAPAPPWGTRDANHEWSARPLARHTFAELGLPLGAGGIELPADAVWVGVRTRASSELDSPMKDALDYVRYDFEV